MSDVYNELSGANRQARAAQNAANAQLAESRSVRDRALNLAEASPQELRAYEQTLKSSERQLANAERMFDSIDPALLEASDQILKILQGEQTSAGGVYEGERARQRQALVDNLRAQYGPGAEFTSLGKRALADFDNNTAVQGVGVQQNSLGTLSNLITTGSNLNTAISNGISNVSGAGRNFGNINTRKINALTGTSQNVISGAGGQFIGDQIRAQGQNQLFNLGVTGTAYAAGNYFGGGATGASAGSAGTGGNTGMARIFAG